MGNQAKNTENNINVNNSLGRFDRGKALTKLVHLGKEARQLVNTMDQLLLTETNTAIDGEKRMKKKVQDHRRALNMLPDAE